MNGAGEYAGGSGAGPRPDNPPSVPAPMAAKESAMKSLTATSTGEPSEG